MEPLTQEQITARIVAEAVASAAAATAKAVSEAAQAAAMIVAKEHASSATDIEVIKTRIKGMENHQTAFESDLKDKLCTLNENFKGVFERLDVITRGRVGPAITALLTILSSATVGLLVFAATR